jgi:hypothetical protein
MALVISLDALMFIIYVNQGRTFSSFLKVCALCRPKSVLHSAQNLILENAKYYIYIYIYI